MRAILINPEDRTITEVEHNGDYKEIYKFIGADCFDIVRIDDKGGAIYLDDEGLYREPQYFIRWGAYPQPLAGKLLILGCNERTGNTVGTKHSLAWVEDNVTWLGDSIRLKEIETTTRESETAFMIMNEAKFEDNPEKLSQAIIKKFHSLGYETTKEETNDTD